MSQCSSNKGIPEDSSLSIKVLCIKLLLAPVSIKVEIDFIVPISVSITITLLEFLIVGRVIEFANPSGIIVASPEGMEFKDCLWVFALYLF